MTWCQSGARQTLAIALGLPAVARPWCPHPQPSCPVATPGPCWAGDAFKLSVGMMSVLARRPAGSLWH